MAERRMIKKNFVESNNFIQMSIEAQYLYFHLILNADDYGIVENAFAVTRTTGTTKEHLQELINNGFLMEFPNHIHLIVDFLIQNRLSKRGKCSHTEILKQVAIDDSDRYVPADNLQESAYNSQEFLRNSQKISSSRVEDSGVEEVEDSKEEIEEIVNYLNEKAGKNFRLHIPKTEACIKARLREGFSVEDFKKVIDTKVKDWKSDSHMSEYLRPETLFGTKFESYLQSCPCEYPEEEEVSKWQ